MISRLVMILAVVVAVWVPAWDAGGGEQDFQESWCIVHGGRLEVVLEDRTRCDCVTATHAIEFDYARKWYQALGQALHYARVSGLRPGIVLIMERPEDQRYPDRLREVIAAFDLPVQVWLTSGD